jgi:hypothetical protein
MFMAGACQAQKPAETDKKTIFIGKNQQFPNMPKW